MTVFASVSVHPYPLNRIAASLKFVRSAALLGSSLLFASTLIHAAEVTPEIKAQVALAALRGDKTVTQLAEQYQLSPEQINEWKQQLLAHATEFFGAPANRLAEGDAQAKAVAQAPFPTANSAASQAAENDVNELEKVLVTSRNREEIAQDVPLPIQVIGGAQLERDGVQSVWDLPGKAPNLRLSPPGENARKVSISIRGVGRNGANDSAEGSVATIVDGVTLYYAGQAWSDYVDLDRIEVLRGPQGTLMGKNTTLGALNIVTKAPGFTPASSFELGTGNFNSLNGKFSSTGPLIDDLLAYRATLVADRADGIYTNTYQSFGNAKETWNETNKLAGRFQFLLTPTSDLSARFIFDKLRSDERTNLGFQWSDGPTNWSDGVPRSTSYLQKFLARSAYFHNADGTPYQPRLGATSFGNSEARPQITNQYGASTEVDWNIKDHTLTSITAYRYQDFDIKNGGNYDQFYISNSGQQLWNKQYSQELRLASNPGKTVDYQVGLYYLNAEVYSDDPTYYGPDAGAWNASNAIYNRLIQTAAGKQLLVDSLNGIYQSSVTDAKVRSLAAYGQADWHLSDKATLTAGLRQTKEHKTNSIEQQLDRPGPTLTAANYTAAAGYTAQNLVDANAVRNASVSTPFAAMQGQPIDANLTAWNFGPSYKLDDNILLYSSLGKGVKSGIVTWVSTTDTTPANISPEKSLDFELGFKSLLLNRRLQFNANLYQTKVTDYQTQISVLQSDGVTYRSVWTNAPGVKARGLELESNYQYSNHLSFSANGAYNLATYDGEFRVARPDVDTTLPQYAGANGTVNLDGKQLYGAPKYTLNLGLNYQAPIFGYLGRVTLSNSYISGTYLAVNQAAFTWQPGYNITNLGIGIGSLDHRYELSLVGKNIFDKFYALSKGTYSSTGAETLVQGQPAFWGLVFRAKL